MLPHGGFKHLVTVVEKIYQSRATTDLKNKLHRVIMGNSCSNTLEIPPGKGPHKVGCADLMVDHTINGSFFRLYYPCVESTGSEKPCWVPSKEYFNGLADFMKINRTVSEKIFSYLYGSFRIPASMDASFKPDGKYPLIIFSHGLGAFRTLYSAICTEIASQGFLVASVEHRDESASATFYYQEKSVPEEEEQQDASKNSSHGQDNLEEVWMYYRVLKPGENEFPLRSKQVKQRADECIRALDILAEINTGCSVTNVLQSQFDWTTLENSMDMCRIAIMGHSFGGATVIESLCKELRFKCGIALDSWMFPLDEEIFPRVKQPILFINSEKFQWAGNIIRMKKLDSAIIPRKMITIKGTVHQSFPDFTFLTCHWIGKILKLKGEIDPQVALDLCNKASLAFLQRHLLLEKNFCQWDHLLDGKDENLIPGTNVNLLESPM
ncbi:platelet-activating factor acetylhydrolase isoform X1 [Megalops cyprinoides]|uniref:platelet-activating factor acetylhydrolase isoform X1 n=2 Tax=Megalops cyprinoides TaxID=118141 RepID=UPI0018652467|nr:platelet-activating factor acetylhydrolase isoform X1 [Megalops cyprinoides]